jgi:hypothetical protein
MPYAIFCNDEQISKAFPTEEAVWKHASENGLTVEGKQRALDNDYEIRPCPVDGENPEQNEREAEEAARDAPYMKV